jgi:hypothetical protein
LRSTRRQCLGWVADNDEKKKKRAKRQTSSPFYHVLEHTISTKAPPKENKKKKSGGVWEWKNGGGLGVGHEDEEGSPLMNGKMSVIN